MATPLTIREKIIRAIGVILDNMKDEVGGSLWLSVIRGELGEKGTVHVPAVGYYDDYEDVLELIGDVATKSLAVTIEFSWVSQTDVDPYEDFNYYLGILQKEMALDHTLGGLCFDVKQVQAKPEIIDKDDNSPSGFIDYEIIFRTKISTPYESV